MRDSNDGSDGSNGSNSTKEFDRCAFLYLRIAIQELHRNFSQLQNFSNKNKKMFLLVSKCASARERIFDLFFCSLVFLGLVGRFDDDNINKILAVIALLWMLRFYCIDIPRYYWLSRKLLSKSGHHCEL